MVIDRILTHLFCKLLRVIIFFTKITCMQVILMYFLERKILKYKLKILYNHQTK
jgi:hypothetical protein